MRRVFAIAQPSDKTRNHEKKTASACSWAHHAGLLHLTRVYLVDDLLLRDGLHALLESAGHQVVGGCSDPTRAVVEAQQLQAQVMLRDLGLGERSGFELLQALRRRGLSVRGAGAEHVGPTPPCG